MLLYSRMMDIWKPWDKSLWQKRGRKKMESQVEDQLREECGVFGVYAQNPCDVAGLVYYGLYALQHRGQESCGIVVNDDGVFSSHKDLGLVNEVFSKEEMGRFPQGQMALGHVRYGTTGGTNRANCQPIEVNHQKGKMALAHNGNLCNAYELRSRLEQRSSPRLSPRPAYRRLPSKRR